MAATCRDQYSRVGPHLFLAFELSGSNWKLGFTIGFGQRPRERNIRAGDLDALEREIGQAKERFGLPEDVPVLSCYEAGRDGFWLHRFLESIDVRNLVVDSSSIEVNRRRRRAKTDSLDVEKLLTMLLRYHGREKKVWHVVHVPTVEQEDHRQLHREMMALKKERTRHINRIKALLAGQGVRMQVRKDFLQQLDATRLWNGSRLPEGLKALLKREHERFQLSGRTDRRTGKGADGSHPELRETRRADGTGSPATKSYRGSRWSSSRGAISVPSWHRATGRRSGLCQG